MTQIVHPYPTYKPSGVEWLGDVPEYWEVRRVGMLAQILNGATPSTDNASYWDGDIVWITPDDLGKLNGRYVTGSARRITEAGYRACGTNLAPAGSIAISTRAPIGHLGVLRSDACVNQGCRLLVPDGAVEVEYLHYALSTTTSTLASFGQGSTFTELSRTLLAAFQLPLPPLPEQRTIVRYLDHADDRIQRYVNAKRKLIALLEEEKQAIVNRAVTRGLDPNVRLKPSGVEWLGDVPEHWEVRRAKFLYREADERSATGAEELMSVSHITGVTPRKKTVTMFMAESNMGYKLCRPGDIVINTMWAFMAALGVARQIGIVSPSYGVYRPLNIERLSHDYIDCLLRTEAYRTNYLIRSTGITSSRLRLYPESFLNIPLLCPPNAEQAAIVECLDKATADIDAAIARARRQIDLVEEYRTRLIADVVTGKLDVREAAARLPDEADHQGPVEDGSPMADGLDEEIYDADEEPAIAEEVRI